MYVVDLASAPCTADSTAPLPVVAKIELPDLLDDLEENGVWIPDKLEGFSVSGP